MSDIVALKAMLDYDTFVQFSPVLFKLRNMQAETKMILSAIKLYYEAYKSEKRIGVDELKQFFHLQNPKVKDPDLIDDIFERIKNVSIENATLLVDVLKRNVEKHIMSQIGSIAESVIQDTKPTGVCDVEQLIQEYKNLSGNIADAENDVCDLSLAELLNSDTQEGLAWRGQFLNNVFGPLKHSTLGHVFARPDAGKTSMALFQCTYFAYQQLKAGSKRPILYLNNEEDIKRIKLRAYCASLKQPVEWLLANMEQADTMWSRRGGDLLKFIGSVVHIDQIRKYLDSFNPRVVVVDQGPKIMIPGKEEGPARLQKLYNIFRNLSGEYRLSIITLGQADNNAENKQYLNLNNMDNSKVAIPGELDWCLGIGKQNDPGMERVRYLNVCKNKLAGRYGFEMVAFHPEKSLYEFAEDIKND